MRYFLTLGSSQCRPHFFPFALTFVLGFVVATAPDALASKKRGRTIPGMVCNGIESMAVGGRTLSSAGGQNLTTGSGPSLASGDSIGLAPRRIRLMKLFQVAAPQPRTVPFELNDNMSHIDWMFNRLGWWIATGSAFHAGDDYYADDWNLGSYAFDKGHTVLSAFPGYVIFAGNNGSGYGNQVIVQSIDDPTFAIRYAHLHTVAVQAADIVYYGSEIGTVGGSGGNYSPHLHSVLYKNIDQGGALDRLRGGYTPGGVLSGGPTIYAAPFENDGDPVSGQCSEDLPCWTWNGDVQACDAHSILFGGKYTQDCAYYFCSGLCLPRGTSNCRAGCPDSEGPSPVACDLGDNDDTDESLPCHTWDGDLDACDEHSILFGDEYTRDCAYYIGSGKCRPRGTSNCLAGIYGDCGVYGCSQP